MREDLYKACIAAVRAWSDIAQETDEAGYSAAEAAALKEKVRNYDMLREAIMKRAGDFVDLKLYDAEMRSLLDKFVTAKHALKLADLEDLSFLDLIKIDKDNGGSVDPDVESEVGGERGVAETLVTADWRTLVAKISDYNKKNPEAPIKGIGKVKALELAAAFELGYRRLRVKPDDLKKMRVATAEAAYEVFKFIAQEGDVLENFWVLPLTAKRIPICEPIRIARGQANTSYVMPRDVFREAIKWDAHCIMVAHNHPSGDHTPSEGDIETTRQLMAMSKDLGIPLLDHLVVSSTGYTSIRDYLKRCHAES